ncbi:hypothetical protein CROQUDRAFT_654459 [Cronartium quercuum f. sp. fusiforme G11]|uniref:Protection of telomeres protein 1 n=1 Tax=Cronartium quercuum f. sp. fusiforme G11 TaxID=708437 RepID=A0A9P6NKS0_9BASI|nr:hypothetical protein CROQUDRAFT_654459 [Cronartium quercuum f. sp. fusiforme G11]
MADPTYLKGVLTDLRVNSDLTAIFLQLEHPRDPCDESQEDPADSRFKGPLHSVRFAGDWVKFLREDLELAWEIHIDLNHFNPSWNSFEDRWEFNSGIQADLLVQDTEDLWYMKKIQLGSSSIKPMRLPPGSLTSRACTTHPHRFTPTQSDSHAPRTVKRSPSMDVKFNLPDSKNKRPRMSNVLSTNDATRTSRPASPNEEVSRDPSESQAFEPAYSSKSDIQSYTPNRGSQFPQPPGSLAMPPATNLSVKDQTPRVPSFMTLNQVENARNAPNLVVNVMGLISHKKSDTCERSNYGTRDYKMTLYLKDASSPASSHHVTCNLFWRTEDACPVWTKANWTVMFLWNVRKRNSDKYDTQIIGASGNFGWALWAPSAFGSAEMLDFGMADPKLIPTCYLNPEGSRSLKRKAAALHAKLYGSQSTNLTTSLAKDQLKPSIAKRISELKMPEPHKVSLCVELIDVWQDGRGNYRLTVTDYTLNTNIVHPPIDWVDDPHARPLSRLHVEHGGTLENWQITSGRTFFIYVSPSIITQLYRHLRPERASQSPGPHDVRDAMRGRYVRLDQVVIRSRGTGGLYGLIEIFPPENHHEDEAPMEAEAVIGQEDFTAPIQMSVLPPPPHHCIELAPLHIARKKWLQDLGQDS